MNRPLTPAEVTAYLARIGYTGPRTPTLAVLDDLQYCHLHTVPYENLDVLRGIPVLLDTDSLFDKIVTHRRGGFCFETNNLFTLLLQAMGFTVTNHFARFLGGRSDDVVPKRRHMVMRVFLPEGLYLADVGVGVKQFRWPLRLIEGIEQPRGGENWRVRWDGFLGWVVENCHHREGWQNFFSFTTEQASAPEDYSATSWFCEHAPDSIFNKQEMLALRTAEGRITMDGPAFKEFTPDGVTIHTPADRAEYHTLLNRFFGIVLSEQNTLPR